MKSFLLIGSALAASLMPAARAQHEHHHEHPPAPRKPAAKAAPHVTGKAAQNKAVKPSVRKASPRPARKGGAQPHHRHTPPATKRLSQALPALPAGLPSWLNNTDTNHIYRKRGPYNDDVYNVPALARDLNGVAVGHAMAYEDLITGKADRLETGTFARIDRVLKNPPRFMPAERFISPTFNRRYGVLEQVFDWTHILHAQVFDVLASTHLTDAEKDREIERLYRFYATEVPYAITPLPMNMTYLDSQPYSKAFRQKYPKVNGLFWGYHWLQGIAHDTLYGKTLDGQRKAYETVGAQYRRTELYRTDRPFMPMFAEVSPKFAARFPHLSNTFDNLHMLHDLVNDILATEWMTEGQKDEQIKRAIWMVSAAAHRGEKPGDAKEPGGLHDHRFMEGMPGMGLMPEGAHAGHRGTSGHEGNGSGSEDHSGHGDDAPAPKAGDSHEGHEGHGEPAPVDKNPDSHEHPH
jgi:hypothetical protein